MKSVVLYGAGKKCRSILELIEHTDIRIEAIFDGNKEKQGTFVGDYEVYPPSDISKFPSSDIFICILNRTVSSEIKVQLIEKLQIPGDKVFVYPEIIKYILKRSYEADRLFREMRSNTRREFSVIFESRFGFGVGGIEAWTKTIYEGLLKEGIPILVLARNVKGKTDSGYDPVREISSDGNAFDLSLNLLTFFCRHVPCIFVSSQPAEELMAATVLKEVFPDKIRIISVIHGGLNDIYQAYLPYKEQTDRYVAVSKRIKSDLSELGVDETEIDIMTCPFLHIDIADRKYSVCEDQPVKIGYAGRIEYSQKRMDLIMRFIERLVDRKVNFSFEIAGEGSAYEDIKTFISERDLGHRVKLSGAVKREEIPVFWRHQDIAINLSDFEGHSISQMEAMSGGAVPIVTDTSGVEDDIENGITGFVVPIGDYETAVRKTEYLADNRDKLKTMGMAAHRALMDKGLMEEHILYWKKLIEDQAGSEVVIGINNHCKRGGN